MLVSCHSTSKWTTYIEITNTIGSIPIATPTKIVLHRGFRCAVLFLTHDRFSTDDWQYSYVVTVCHFAFTWWWCVCFGRFWIMWAHLDDCFYDCSPKLSIVLLYINARIQARHGVRQQHSNATFPKTKNTACVAFVFVLSIADDGRTRAARRIEWRIRRMKTP